jgi:hypothetical protein
LQFDHFSKAASPHPVGPRELVLIEGRDCPQKDVEKKDCTNDLREPFSDHRFFPLQHLLASHRVNKTSSVLQNIHTPCLHVAASDSKFRPPGLPALKARPAS